MATPKKKSAVKEFNAIYGVWDQYICVDASMKSASILHEFSSRRVSDKKHSNRKLLSELHYSVTMAINCLLNKTKTNRSQR